MELLGIYQDLLDAQVQTPEPAVSVADELEERSSDRASVHSLIEQLDGSSPPEPGTSQSHIIGVGSRGPIAHYRRALSQVAVMLEGMDAAAEYLDPSPSKNMVKQQMLPSPSEWAALTRECVSTLDCESLVDRFRFSRSA